MTKAEYVSCERAIGIEGSLHQFVQMAWHVIEPDEPFIDNWHIEEICKALEDVYTGKIRRLIINISPGGMKSLLVSVFWPVWIWIRKPGWRSIYTSFSKSLVLDHAQKQIDIVQSPWFQERWGHICKIPDKNPAAGEFKNDHRGWRFSESVRGQITGRHADVVIVDDPLKPLDTTTVGLAGVIQFWTKTLSSRLRNVSTGRKVLIMQRLHEGDLAGYCLSKEGHEGWTHLRFPMRYETAYPDPRDPRTEEGELFFPARFPRAAVDAQEIVLGPMGFAAQYQQRPSPEGGAIFRREWFQYYDDPPADFDDVVQSWDCTFKGTASADYVVGQVWGRKGSKYYLLYQVRGQMTFTETCQAIRSVSRMFPEAITKLIEEAANGAAVCDALEDELDGITRVKPEGGKVARANAVTGLWQAGNVLLPNPDKNPWVDQFTEEHATFPVGTNDDQVDSGTQAVNYLRDDADYFAAAMARLAEDGI